MLFSSMDEPRHGILWKPLNKMNGQQHQQNGKHKIILLDFTISQNLSSNHHLNWSLISEFIGLEVG